MPSNSEFSLCVAVLAAGQSRRFVGADKLVQPLDGTMLGLHICDAIKPLNCAHSVVIASADDHPCSGGWQAAGFEIPVNENAAEGLGTSVACAARFASDKAADALLICLADMPFVPAGHLQDLVSQLDPENLRTMFASDDGIRRSPPAIFAASHFAELTKLKGPAGARDLLAVADTIKTPPQWLADIDTREQLALAQSRPIDV
ncbi:MAG: nucleotidyltransferase family protein [Marinomonas sp.]